MAIFKIILTVFLLTVLFILIGNFFEDRLKQKFSKKKDRLDGKG